MNWYKKKKKKEDKNKTSKDFLDVSGVDLDIIQRPNNTRDTNDEVRLD